VLNQKNSGGPAARNRGFRESKGDMIVFWDADVVAVPTMLEKMHQALLENPNASYAYSRFKFGWKTIRSLPFDTDQLRRVNYITATSLIRRADFPGWDESLKRFQDWDLWLTMLAQNKTGVFVPEILFRAEVGGRAGISKWLPSFVYRLPFKIKAVREYESARAVIAKKHHLS
jgi:glycosyltransferase involved in cell wall biosynthesis